MIGGRHFRAAKVFSVLLSLGAAAHGATTPIWAGAFGGLYKSTDSGATWNAVTVSVNNPILQGSPNPQTPNVIALAIDPQQPATVYFVGQMPGSEKTGFYRSTDDGASWTGTVLDSGMGVFFGPYILIDPVLTNIIYQIWTTGLAKSTDYGATWAMANVPILPDLSGGATLSGFNVDPNTSGVLYWTSGTLIYKSVDFANTWTLLTPVVTSSSNLLLGDVALDPHDRNVLLVGNRLGAGDGLCGAPNARTLCGLFRSADGGQNWTNSAPEGEYAQIAFDSSSGVPYVWAAAKGFGDRVFSSADDGNTWLPASNQSPFPTDFPINLFADPAAGSSLLGFAWGANVWYRSTDAGATFSTSILQAPASLNPAGPKAALAVAAVPKALGNVSAASFQSGPVAPESMVSALGFDLGTAPLSAEPPPITLGQTTVSVVDSKGISRFAPLFYVSPSQINYEIPAGTASGVATITVKSGDGMVSMAPLGIAPVAPGLFKLNSAALAAADAVQILNGIQTYVNVYQLDSSNALVALPIDLGPTGEDVYLVLYGTGVRGATKVSATIGGVSVPVLFTGAQGQFAGEDQINVGPIPRSLAGRGNIPVILTADGIAANTVNVTIR